MKKGLLTLFFCSAAICALAGPYNIAPEAKATASSELSAAQGASKVNDGIIGIENQGEWLSGSGITIWGEINFPWVQLEWESPRSIDKIVLYDRASGSRTTGGMLRFSDGSRVSVYAIPDKGRGKEVTFAPKKVKWVRFEATDGINHNIGLSEIEVYPSPGEYTDYVSMVDPYIETTCGRYFYFLTGSRPFGMIASAPMTRNKNQSGGGYNYNSLEILGFPQVHGWMMSGISMMPTTGSVDPTGGEQRWKSAFSHEGEVVQPGYHRVLLEDYGVWVEQTATERVSFYRLRYVRDAVSNLLVSLGGYLGECSMNDCRITRVSDTEVEGSVNTTGRFWGGPEDIRIFFVMKTDKPFERLDGWNDRDNVRDIATLNGKKEKTARNAGESYYDTPGAGYSAVHHVKAGEELKVKFAISYTSIENARQNMQSECDHWDFDKVLADSREVWNHWLGRIDVEGGGYARRTKFYTDLWHVLLGRHKIDDVSGDYPDYTQGRREGVITRDAKLVVRSLPRDKQGKPKFHMYNSDGLWLTQWNINILLGLAWPQMQDELSSSLLQYAVNGGLLPRGPIVGGYSYIMTSSPSTNMITSAYQKGILTGFDAATAFRLMAKNHEPGGMLGLPGPDEKLKFYIGKGYYPGNAGITIEAAFQDWTLSQMAAKMGDKKNAAYFKKRSEGWRKLYDPQLQLIMPKTEGGEWLHRDPLSSKGWVEANAWQATWGVSHDIPGLASLMGGNDALCDKLNYAFERADSVDFIYAYGGGYISYANQPGCSDAHVFNLAGKPWLSQYWVRKVVGQAYGDTTPDLGYGGHDEDQGQMGGVSALMSMGLFSVQGTSALSPRYEITSPLFDRITIKLDPEYYKGKEFIIETHNNSEQNCYIQRSELNGQPSTKYWLGHDQFTSGGKLELWLGPEPNKGWGTEN